METTLYAPDLADLLSAAVGEGPDVLVAKAGGMQLAEYMNAARGFEANREARDEFQRQFDDSNIVERTGPDSWTYELANPVTVREKGEEVTIAKVDIRRLTPREARVASNSLYEVCRTRLARATGLRGKVIDQLRFGDAAQLHSHVVVMVRGDA